MSANKRSVSSGVGQLDRLLNGLFIGDNVVWYDDAGSLASVFCLNFMQASQQQRKPMIYVSFDRSPRNLLDKLGPLAAYKNLILLDCFTHGKGAGADVFLDFYKHQTGDWPCRIVRVEEPRKIDRVTDAFYGIHKSLKGDVRFVFESLTGMQELWEGEEHLLAFYSHSCPRLYELNTIAYWIIEKEAHSARLKARINQIAQVAVDLSVRRGKTSLTILKAEKRDPQHLNTPHPYWSRDLTVVFDSETRTSSRIALGSRLKKLRTKRGLSQTELARLVGVTPSTISQVESNQIYPSLPALFKIAEILSVEAGSFFQETSAQPGQAVFKAADAQEIKIPDLPRDILTVKLLTPVDLDPKAEPFLIEIPANGSLHAHFFIHKGEEAGYLLSGKLQMELNKSVYSIDPGDLIYLTADIPSGWKNPGPGPARLLWFKIK
ncbi:MAG: helix-turn-helix domain-containing protein [Thermodesulfobacteriota bacterium]